MPFISVYIHFVWATKHRFPYLIAKGDRLEVWKHIRKNAIEKGIHLDFVSGYTDHCHCIVSLKPTQSPDEVMRMIKGESSNYINDHICNGEFAWQQGYYAAAVPIQRLDKLREYIKNQEEHHKSQDFDQEYEKLLLKIGFKKVGIDWS